MQKSKMVTTGRIHQQIHTSGSGCPPQADKYLPAFCSGIVLFEI
jgi:hypothetical protein